jgi:LacI family transcriptional regulator
MKDVAKLAGVSTATVSHVINKNRFVSESTTQTVLEAMEQLQYQPNALARSLRRKNTLTLGLVLPDSANPFYAEVARGIEDLAYQEGYTVLFGSTEDKPEKEADYLRVFREKQVDGVILLTVGKMTDHIQVILEQNIPLVIVDHEFKDIRADCVIAENRRGGFLAARHLIQLGHRRIACIYGSSHRGTGEERLNGFEDALRENNIPVDPGLVASGDFTAEGGYFAGKSLLAHEPDRPTAIFACNDLMAFGAMGAVYEAGLRIPEDISIVGFDDISLSGYVFPPLTTVHQPKYEMGYLGAKILLEQIRAVEPIPSRLHVLPTELIIRKSTQPLKVSSPIEQNG